jgi:murein DD-endopeptidase MepM/ murein hydrolase activator NlpD
LKEDSFTLSIIPHSGKSPKIYRISRWHIYLFCGMAGFVFLVLTLFTYGHLSRYSEEWDLMAVLEEKEALEIRLNEMTQKVSAFEEKMDRVTSTEIEFREIAGLAGIDPEVREVGIGGPGPTLNGSGSIKWMDEETGQKVELNEETLSTLFRRADLVHQSLVESVEQMEYNHDKFLRTPSIWPATGRISSKFGARVHPIFGRVRPHEGIDIYASRGTPIVATADGKVIHSGWEIGYGLSMIIDHGYGLKTMYAHCSKLKKNRGEEVKRGEVIALMGKTGISTGTHLHYEVVMNGKSVNPVSYLLGTSVPD